MKVILFAVGCSALVACGADQSSSSGSDTQEIVENLVAVGFPANDIQVVDGKVYTGRDAEVSLEASREMLQRDASDEDEQYRTTNLVGSSITNICINGAAFSGTFSTALNNAISNYNALGLRWHMTRTSGSTAGCSATITAKLTTGAGGVSGFPSGGRPYNTINIGSDTSQYGVNTTTHVITHELGHTVGFRHSDYYNRAISCGGSASNEGDGGVGAILISGTPSNATVGGSIMNSCFRASETGKFTSTDKTALNALY
ncbi:MAG TPA: M57 family metalloprotease [Kofleriaceae bacterium]